MNAPQEASHAVSSSDKPGTIRLSPEDRARMARLYEETYSRLQEMALIVARNLGMDVSQGIQPTFKKPDSQIGTQRVRNVDIVCTPTGCGCYDYDAGTCHPC
jgi:hypothetical protein